MSDVSNLRQTLTVIIVCIGVFGITIGLGMPLLSIQLEARGVSESLIGLVAAMPAFGTMLVAPFLPRWLARTGIRPLLFVSLFAECLAFLFLPVWNSVTGWVVIRFLMGASGAVLFVASETWINQIAPEHARGRILAIYSIVLGMALATGPAILGVVDPEGHLPFFIGAGIVFLAIAVLFFGGQFEAPLIGGGSSFNVFGFIFVAPTIVFSILVTSLHDVSVLSLLPVYGVQSGYSPGDAALLVSAFAIGLVLLTWPIGWLADHVNRYGVLFGCGIGSLLGAMALPYVIQHVVVAWVCLFVWGGCLNGLYSTAMTIVGERFRGAELATAQSSFGVIWGFGSLVGPLSVGAAMDVAGVNAMPLVLALVAAAFLVVATLRRLLA